MKIVPLTDRSSRVESWPIRNGYVHSLSGPDLDGHVALLEDRLFSDPKSHLLKVLSLRDGSVTVLFDRPGSALWDETVGEHVALAPAGEKAAVVTGLRPVQMRSPDAYLHEGTLEIWDIESQRQVYTLENVADDALGSQPVA